MQQYPNAAGFTDTDTSKTAANIVNADTNFARNLILETISSFDEGLTADQVAALCDYKVLFCRPRVSELHALKKIEKTGERRKNASGLSAAVWRKVA